MNLDFWCTFCGKDFADNPIKLALHIADKHDDRPSGGRRG